MLFAAVFLKKPGHNDHKLFFLLIYLHCVKVRVYGRRLGKMRRLWIRQKNFRPGLNFCQVLSYVCTRF